MRMKFASFGLGLLLAAPAFADEPAQALPREEIEKIVREYLLRESEIDDLLREFGRELFGRLLGWERGRYRLLKRAPEADERITLPETPKLLLEGLRHRASLELPNHGPDDRPSRHCRGPSHDPSG